MMFKHYFITRDLPGETDWGYEARHWPILIGMEILIILFQEWKVFIWFENRDIDNWETHDIGALTI